MKFTVRLDREDEPIEETVRVEETHDLSAAAAELYMKELIGYGVYSAGDNPKVKVVVTDEWGREDKYEVSVDVEPVPIAYKIYP